MASAALIITSAPGSLMLLGEHAVLHGKHALVCAINRRITVCLSPTEDHQVEICSGLGNYQSPLANLAEHPSLKFVLQAIQQHRERLPSGFRLRIESEFSADIGLGSSAAVTVATHAALMRWTMNQAPKHEDLFSQSIKTVHAVQGRGSGADLAASVFGGCVGYSTMPQFLPVEVAIPLTAIYCGYKTPTSEVIRTVEKWYADDPEKYNRIYSEMDRSVGKAISCLQNHDFPTLGQLLNYNQQLMDEMGVNTPELQEIVAALQNHPEILGAKISGSGLGDCAVGLGHAGLSSLGYPVYHLETTPVGCTYHE